ncbi:hypothetical protein [Christiangramia sp. LLG6405-1]|uniref:hypothetical protein n=1 Tax=Christiangramia sp. LLG6405-1 TaxID=3160832 RepID=UPI00386B40F8
MGNFSKNKNILGLVITDGVGFRNFILSEFLRTSAEVFDKVIIYSALPSECYENKIDPAIEIVELFDHREHGSTWFFRKAKEIAHLKNNASNNFGIQDNLKVNYSNSSSRRGKLTRLIYKLTNKYHSENWINTYYNLQQKSFSMGKAAKRYRGSLRQHKPSILFFTHQRPPYLAPLIYSANKENINTCSFIFSWDNLASKGRMAGNFKNYLVWSKLMKSELLQFYRNLDDAQIKIVGTPQFEPYVMVEYQSSINDFYKRFKLNENYKTICFSCGDVSTSANDPLYIETIAEAILSSEINEVNFLVRTSPAEEPDRFQYLENRYPFIKWNYPSWEQTRNDHAELWSQRVPTEKDLKDLRMILEFSDLGVNMCSTMSLDFMTFDKPVINPVFGNSENGLYDDQRFLQYAHYSRVVKSGAVSIAKDRDELIEHINFSLENPKARLDNQRELLNLQIGNPLEGTSKRISEVLNELS